MNPTPKKTSYTLEEVMQMYGQSQPSTKGAPLPAAEQAPAPYGASFPSAPTDTPLQAGAKSLGNIPSSAINLGKGIFSALSNPVETIKGVSKLASEVLPLPGKYVNDALSLAKTGEMAPTPARDALVDTYKDRYGSIDKAKDTFVNDPVGAALDVLGVGGGVATVFGKGQQFANATSKVGQTVTRPVSALASTIATKAGNTARFGISQATGLSPQTIKTITGNVDDFAKAQAQGTTRTDLADDVIGAVNKAGDELSDLGQAYNPIRQSGSQVSLPENWLQASLEKYGLKSSQGKVVADKASRTRNSTDIAKIQEFIDNWGDSRTLTADEYLNMRHDLAELAKYDQTGKSTVVRQMAQDIREGVLNADEVRNQIPGLKELDARYADDITFYNKLKKDFLNADGTIKDGAASKIVNSINSANPERLARIEKLYPGFTKQAQVIKALEDVENAMGLKVGTYTRGALIGGQALMGNVPGAVITAVLTQPEIAVPLLKGYGYTAKNIGPVLQSLKTIADDINNFRVPGALEDYINQKYPDGVPLGLSIKSTVTPESVAENLSRADIRGIAQIIDDVGLARMDPNISRFLADKGLAKASDAELVRFLKEVIDEAEGVGTRQILKP